MLSNNVIKNIGQASHYYSQQDNYYSGEQGIEQSEWWGRGAGKLALSGQVDTNVFTALLTGKLPNGEQLGKIIDGNIKHRSGWDLTFSAPKSVSILALIGGDTRLLNAHRNAVSTALSKIERSAAQARVSLPSGMTYQNTNNIVAALYHHDLSRANDPQLHTHSIIMNMTERLDGKWRSLASKLGVYDEKTQGEVNGFIERVRHDRRYFSKLYETELAFHVKELGYEITTDTESGIFEIIGVTKEAIQFFSKRRMQIESKLSEKGLSGGKAAAFATLDTRDVKENVDRTTLKAHWQMEAAQVGLNCQAIIESSRQKTLEQPIEAKTSDDYAVNAIHQAAKSLSVFQTTFTIEEMVTCASEYVIGKNVNVVLLIETIESQISSGQLLSLPNACGKTVLMAASTLEEEKRLFSLLEDKKLAEPTIDPSELKNYLERYNNISHHHADLKALFGDDRIVLIEGEKARDSLVEPIMKIAKSAHLNMVLLSPSLIGSKKFANKFKQEPTSFWERIKALFMNTIPTHFSVMQFLSEQSENKIAKNEMPRVLLVENAHLLSTHQKTKLFEWNKVHQAKLILLGNKTTLLSQQIGVSLNQLSEKGVTTISLQSQEGTILKATEEGNIHAVVNKISDRIVEVTNQDERHQAMATHYSKLGAQDRKQSWLIAHSKQTVNELNLLTHQSLLKQGKLKKVTTINVLLPVYLPEGKGALAASYQKGQIVRFNESYSTLQVSRGEYLHVVSNSKTSNRVILQKDNGIRIIWKPEKIAGGLPGKVELFNEQSREFAINETVMLSRSLKSKEMVKGERFSITTINQRKMVLNNSEGKAIAFDLSKPYHRHLDYGYAATLHAIAHEKPVFLIAELPTRAFHTDQRRFYQAVSQPKEVWIYTDSDKGLISHLEKKTGNRLTAHKTLSQSQELKKNLHSLYDILEKEIVAQKRNQNVPTLSPTAVNAVEYAMHHLSEREAGFTHKELMQTAMQHALGDVNPEALSKASVAMEKAGILIRGNRTDGALWTTADAVKMERELIALCNQNKGKLEPIACETLLEKHCDPTKLKPEQIAAVKAITQSKDRVMAVQGHPGTGKTTMLATVADVIAAKNIYESEGYELLGLAPTHPAVKELAARGIPSQTLDSFIILTNQELANTNQPIKRDKLILIIDEASMVSTRKMVEILQIAHQLECRGVIPMGDTRQLPSIESGKAFELVQREVNTQSLVDIRRQQDDTLKQAVKETIAYDFKAAMQTLKDSIIQVPMPSRDGNLSLKEMQRVNREERVERLVEDYFSFPKEKRENIQIITPGHDDRKLANTLIRGKLKEEGTLEKDKDQTFPILRSKNLTHIERSHVTNLAVGDVLRFGKRETTHIKAEEYFTIAAINPSHRLLTLKGENGREVIWQVPTFDKKRLSQVEVYQKESRLLQVGEVIRWSRSDKKNELLSTETARVTTIDKNKVTVVLSNKQELTFDSSVPRFQHWDHGYAATVYAVQGKTQDIILAHMESFRENLTTQPSFLVALTRAVNVFRLYTDDAKKLLNTIERNTGVKLSSLEVIGEFSGKCLKKDRETPTQMTMAKMILAPVSKEKVKENKYSFDRYAIECIKESLNKDAERIAIDILGTPKERGSHYLKFGRNQGSLTVTIKGEKQGWFNDFETNQGGRDMLKFIQVHGGMERQEALQYGAKWAGIFPDKESSALKDDPKKNTSKPDLSKENVPASFSDYEKRRIKLANKIARESDPIRGTLAEKYLRQHRGIYLEQLPEDIRFHPNIYSHKNQKTLPALVAIVRDKDRGIRSVEAIYLDANTADKANVPLSKQTIGPKKGAVVMINQTSDPNAPTLIAEGVVTGLSLAQSIPNANVRIVLGKKLFISIDPAVLTQKTIFCLDNDGENLKTDKAILEAANRLRTNKKDVSFMVPTVLDMQKQDYNDILKQKGSRAIQADFQHAVSYEDFYKNLSISQQKLAQLSREIAKETALKDNARLLAYQAITANKQEVALDKTLPKIKETSREI